MPTKVEKVAWKSNNIPGTPKRNKTMEVTPNAKQASKREQDNVKKSKRERKNDLLKYFGDEACIPAPTNVGMLINAVIPQRRENRDKGNNTHDKAGDRGGGAKKSALKKSSKSLSINASM